MAIAANGDTRTTTDWAEWLDSFEGLPVPIGVAVPAPPGPRLFAWMETAAGAVPGLMLAGLVAGVAYVLAEVVGARAFGLAKSPVGSVPVAIVLGMLLRNLSGVPRAYEAGLRVSVRTVLRAGIVLLGLRLSLPAAGAIGLAGLPLVAVCIAAALGATLLYSKLLGLDVKQGALIGAGTGICGVSAIAAAAPVIEADEDDVTYAVACVTLFGLVAMLTYPWLAAWLFGGDARLAGFFLGTSIHDTAQVTGAGMMYRQQFHAPLALDVATVTKLVRNTSMVLLIPLLGYFARSKKSRGGLRLGQAVPVFVLAYLVMAGVRSVGDLGSTPFGVMSGESWKAMLGASDMASAWLLATAMAAVGIGTEFSRIKKLGWRPMAAGLGAALTVGGVSVVWLKLFGAGL